MASLLTYLAAHGQAVWGFELGNEVNNNGGAPCNQTAAQQAAAMRTFAAMAAAQQPAAVLIGPDSGYRDWQQWLTDYLPLMNDDSKCLADGAVCDVAEPAACCSGICAGCCESVAAGNSSSGGGGGGGGGGNRSVLHAVTHHVYPGASRSSFNSPSALDRTTAEVLWYTHAVAALAPGAQVWAGEDGPIGGGDDGTCGRDSVCATYASALWYADDLASRAAHGFVQYQRQAFVGGAYGLVAAAAAHPSQGALGPTEAVLLRPGYWVNFLWKRVLGRSVHNATVSSPAVRAYAFSGAPPSPFAEPACAAAGDAAMKQLLLINLSPDENATVTFGGVVAAGGGASASFSAWVLSPPPSSNATAAAPGALDPFSDRARLNGELLPALVDGAAPFLTDVPVAAVTGSGATQLSPLSIAFLCFH